MKYRNIANQIHNDPRGRSEDKWINTLKFLVSRLAYATSSNLHIGRYWISDIPGDVIAASGARVRAKSPFPYVESDYWEAAICYTGNKEHAYSDVFAFPFLKGSPVTSRGRIADFGEVIELDEFWWFQFVDGEFKSKGWSFPDGLGEWGWITKPGDEYLQCIKVTLISAEFQPGSPIEATISVPLLDKIYATRSHPNISVPRVSLVHVNRNRENTNLVPWNCYPPRINSRNIQLLDQLTVSKSTLKIDLTSFNIRGGWVPGKYHMSLRLQNFHEIGDWTATSEISEPFKFIII